SLPLEQVFAPAAELAREGFPVSPKLAAALAAEAEADSPLFRHPPSAAVFAPEGRPLRAGELMRNPGYALTLGAMAPGGAGAVFRGGAGARDPRAQSRHGGLLYPHRPGGASGLRHRADPDGLPGLHRLRVSPAVERARAPPGTEPGGALRPPQPRLEQR